MNSLLTHFQMQVARAMDLYGELLDRIEERTDKVEGNWY